MEAAIAAATRSAAILLLLSVVVQPTKAEHNISEILSHYPEYSVYNGYLSQTKVSDEINSRETVTCLVLRNQVISSLAAKHPLSAVKNALRLLTLLDYYDSAKLHSLSGGTVQVTTLLQTTGTFRGNLGFANVTDLRGGKVGFGSTYPGSKLNSSYTRSVEQLPYSISVLEVSGPIVFPGLLDVSSDTSDGASIVALLEKAGCKTFSSLLASSGVLRVLQDAAHEGLTVFAPNDEAFKADAVPKLTALSKAELVTLLQYHAIPEYAPKATLKVTKDRHISTLATGGTRKFDLAVTSSGDDVTLDTGLDSSRIASAVIDAPPLCILAVDSVLLPIEMFGKAPASAPAPTSVEAPAAAPSETPKASSVPAPTSVSTPEREQSSPSATPPSESPELSPASSPDADADDFPDGGGTTARSRHLLAIGISCFLATISSTL